MRLLHALGVAPSVLLEPSALYQRSPGESWKLAQSWPDRHGAALQSIECAEALLTDPRHELLRHTLGMTSKVCPPSWQHTSMLAILKKPFLPLITLLLRQVFGRLSSGPEEPNGRAEGLLRRDEERRVVLYSCLVLPWASLVTTKAALKGAARGLPAPIPEPTPSAVVPASRFLIAEGLKRPTRDADTVVRLHEAAARFQALLANGPASGTSRRAEAGLTLRHAGPLWRASLLTAIVNTTLVERPPSIDGALARNEPSLLEVANRGASPMADVLSDALSLEMQASARYAAPYPPKNIYIPTLRGKFLVPRQQEVYSRRHKFLVA